MTKSDTPEGQEMTDRQKKTIPFFVGSSTVEDGCRKARISRETYYKWLADPLFRTALKRARDQVVEEALDAIKGSMNKAAQSLVTLLEKTKNENLKKAIAIDILGYGMKVIELSEIEERLGQIEKKLDGNKKR